MIHLVSASWAASHSKAIIVYSGEHLNSINRWTSGALLSSAIMVWFYALLFWRVSANSLCGWRQLWWFWFLLMMTDIVQTLSSSRAGIHVLGRASTESIGRKKRYRTRRWLNFMWKMGIVLKSTSSTMSSSTCHSWMAGKMAWDWGSDQFQFSTSLTLYLARPPCFWGTLCR